MVKKELLPQKYSYCGGYPSALPTTRVESEFQVGAGMPACLMVDANNASVKLVDGDTGVVDRVLDELYSAKRGDGAANANREMRLFQKPGLLPSNKVVADVNALLAAQPGTRNACFRTKLDNLSAYDGLLFSLPGVSFDADAGGV